MAKEVLVLFVFFTAFVFINFATYVVLYFRMKEKLFARLALYWLLVLIIYPIEGKVQSGKLSLSLVFIVNLPAIYIMANFLMTAYGLELNPRKYIWAAIGAMAFACINNTFGLPFIALSLPVALVASFPFVEAVYATFVTKKNQATFVQKFMAGAVFSSGIFACLNYAVNRLTPGTELLGFGSAFLSYIGAAIILPVFAIEELNREKTEKLEILVKERTAELLTSKVQKEKLLRVVVHDISNALQVLILQTNRLASSQDPKVVEASSRIMKNLDSISGITRHVKEMEYLRAGSVQLQPVSIDECFAEVKELFIDRFHQKNVALEFNNKVPGHVVINVDKVTFIHSVASNIISNALKFSYPESTVIVTAYEENNLVHIEVQDYGVGMSEKFLSNLFEFEASFTTMGTGGERGTGFGMPLVKNYTEIFGGKVYATSSQNKEASGTRIQVILPAITQRDHATSLN
jgi:signal transduction histidine kinase